jgi:glycosyltransferase involved in cell wall biosynthesis
METSETSGRLSYAGKDSREEPEVSIVIPAYNEASRIGGSIRKIDEFVRGIALTSEIVVVDDGSTDDTARVVRAAQPRNLRLILNNRNHGKGYSVRQGVLAATGAYVLVTDADLSAPIAELSKLLDVAIDQGADVVIGSRSVDRRYIEKHQSRARELGGIAFNLMVRLLLGLRLHDTQCGFKLFHRAKTRLLFEKQTAQGFGFDPELLFLAKRHGLVVREVPVRWSHSEGSKVNPLRDGLRMLSDLVRFRWNAITGRYS